MKDTDGSKLGNSARRCKEQLEHCNELVIYSLESTLQEV